MGKGCSRVRTFPDVQEPGKPERAAKVGFSAADLSGDSPAAQFHQQYRLGDIIGKGATAQVHAAVKVNSDAECAVKVIYMNRANRKCVTSEISVLKKLSAAGSPHVVMAHELFVDDYISFIVMERCEKSLLSYLECSGHFDEKALQRLLRTSLRGLLHMHNHNVVHRDFKPDNLLTDRDGNAKVCDFGFARELPATSPRMLKGIIGTAPYMSPEMLDDRFYDTSTDVWSFGTTVHVLLLGRFPYGLGEMSTDGMKAAILKGTPEPTFATAPGAPTPSEASMGLMRWTLERDPEVRPSTAEAAQHRYAQDFFGDSQLPGGASFRPVLRSARRSGAFCAPANRWDNDQASQSLRKAVEAEQAFYHRPRLDSSQERRRQSARRCWSKASCSTRSTRDTVSSARSSLSNARSATREPSGSPSWRGGTSSHSLTLGGGFRRHASRTNTNTSSSSVGASSGDVVFQQENCFTEEAESELAAAALPTTSLAMVAGESGAGLAARRSARRTNTGPRSVVGGASSYAAGFGLSSDVILQDASWTQEDAAREAEAEEEASAAQAAEAAAEVPAEAPVLVTREAAVAAAAARTPHRTSTETSTLSALAAAAAEAVEAASAPVSTRCTATGSHASSKANRASKQGFAPGGGDSPRRGRAPGGADAPRRGRSPTKTQAAASSPFSSIRGLGGSGGGSGGGSLMSVMPGGELA